MQCIFDFKLKRTRSGSRFADFGKIQKKMKPTSTLKCAKIRLCPIVGQGDAGNRGITPGGARSHFAGTPPVQGRGQGNQAMKMKLKDKTLVIWVACIWFMITCSSCSRPVSDEQSPRVLLPWIENGQYHFRVVELRTMESLKSLRGSVARFSVGVNGPEPIVRALRRSDGVFVPTDPMSQNLLSLYANLERLAELDDQVGVGYLLPRPWKISINTNIVNENQRRLHNNAQYDADRKMIEFTSFESRGDLPLTVNAGAIAHEHFHALFDVLVPSPASLQDCSAMEADQIAARREARLRELYRVRLLRAMNEGLADVWGWIHSGDPRFVARSRPEDGELRSLEKGIQPIWTAKQFSDYNRAEGFCPRRSDQDFVYQLGNQYGLAFQWAFGSKDRVPVAHVVIELLRKLKKDIMNFPDGDELKPALLIENLARQNPRQCPFLISILQPKDQSELTWQCWETL
ncbi:MAG: hypothetical protein C5B49_05840 [Bdellovibrio sp.]|nr:MAG: hypothetical protein C5B49_05840 [Bdellovibrio sp.]